jgi:hypothetical protein
MHEFGDQIKYKNNVIACLRDPVETLAFKNSHLDKFPFYYFGIINSI